jgi:sigma-B regulation protein RsbU (phosphoserine phosphatase)
MSELFLPPDPDEPKKRVWKTWKKVGLALLASAYFFGDRLPAWMVVPPTLFGLAASINLLFHFLRYLRDRLFWRVRNRILGAFIFVGFIPLLLILGTVYFTAYIVAGQLAVNYLNAEVRELAHDVASINAALGQQLTSQTTPAEFELLAAQSFRGHSEAFPRLAVHWVRSGKVLVFDPEGITRALESMAPQKWITERGDFEGLVRQDESVMFAAIRIVPGAPGDFLELFAPLDAHIERRLQREKSTYATFAATGNKDVTVSINNSRVKLGPGADRAAERRIEERIEAAKSSRGADRRRMGSWGTVLECKNLRTGQKDVAGFALVHVPVEILYRVYFTESFAQGKFLIILIGILLGLFLAAELVSLLIGWTISRRITRSVHDLYQGTLALQKGDLQHVIPVRKRDQLGLLAHSFNQMSGSITRLLEEVTEKKRLEQELEIAREVQTTLFPKQLPQPKGFSVFGGCEPARVVSGDYYDFIVEDEAHLDIVVGDISGKGISAALMMANLQAAMHNQLAAKRSGSFSVEQNLADIVGELNRQIFRNSPSEKYVTLFTARFDAETHLLCYCNAGHLPPMVLDGGGDVRRLDTGGMVVGLFEHAVFEAATVEFARGSMLLIFTDGITEAINDAGEEFGEDRLLVAVRERRTAPPESIYRHVVEQVRLWQGSLKQHDDMTLIVAKAE